MALTNEEKDTLFETIKTSENIEDRAEAILKLQAELHEQDGIISEANKTNEELTQKWRNAQDKAIELMNSVPTFSSTTKEDEKKKEDEEKPELKGFEKLRR